MANKRVTSTDDEAHVCTRAEILEALSQAVHRGHVPAMRLLLEELKADQPERSRSIVDELADRRSRRAI